MAVIYQQLCPVLYGTDAISEMAKRAADEGRKRAYIVCDKGVRQAGAPDKIAKALDAVGIVYEIFDDAQPDAPDACVNGIAAKMADFAPDLILGVGGGSSLDAAKAAGVAYEMGNPINVYMEENGNPGFNLSIPTYVIPTTAGTGSEVTPMCVIHEMASDSKKVVLRRADLAVLDPTLTVTCPPSVTVYSGFDALSHTIEAYTSVNPNPKDMILAINAMRLIRENLPIAAANPNDLEARGNLLIASNLAGIAFAEMSIHIGHCFAHEVGLRFEITHGMCCGWSVPETVRYVAEKKPKEILDIAKVFDVEIPEGTSAKDAGELVAAGLRKFTRSLGLKSPKELGIDRAEMIAIAKDAIDHNWFHVMCPGDVSYEQMAQYLADAYDNYQ